MGNNNYRIPKFPPRLVIPQSFQDCLSYGQRQLYMWKVIQELQDRVTELEEKVEELTQVP